jgi:hypothetical protein
MRAKPIITVVQYLGGAIMLSFFVALLTFIFSFLGTIFCAALAGMMLGALKKLRWHALAISLLFPLVAFALLRGMRAELPGRQLMFVSVICFATFWLTYVMGATLLSLERRSPAAGVTPQGHTGSSESTGQTTLAVAAAESVPMNLLNLDVLQGTWSCAAAAASGRRGEKTLEIEEEKLVLRITDASGRLRFFGRGNVKLDSLASRQLVTISLPGCEVDADAGGLASI